MIETIKLNRVELDSSFQPRSEIDSALVEEYADNLEDGQEFPPINVIQDGERYFVWDGWHRVLASRKIGMLEIGAIIQQGTARDAMLHSAAANATHGARRTNADKRRAVGILLDDPTWSKWSSREIARRCNVSKCLVDNIRVELTGIKGSDTENATQQDRYYINRHGTKSVMNIENVGDKGNLQPTGEAKTTSNDIMIRNDGIAKFNKTNDNIEWALWTWNPVTGCNHGCKYCYARDIETRFSPERNFKPTFRENRLDAPNNTNPTMDHPGGRNVFVCSMADLFGDWVPNEWIFKIINKVKESPQWTFLFLTKNPSRMTSVIFPENAWAGTTVDSQDRVKAAEEHMQRVEAPVRFVSCEPMLTPIEFTDIDIFDWVIIGGQSKTTHCEASQPKWRWVLDLTNQATNAGCGVYWKPNLTVRPRQYPGDKDAEG